MFSDTFTMLFGDAVPEGFGLCGHPVLLCPCRYPNVVEYYDVLKFHQPLSSEHVGRTIEQRDWRQVSSGKAVTNLPG